MACRLVGAKPLSQPMLEYCQLDPWEQTSMKFQSQFIHFYSRKCIWKCRNFNRNSYIFIQENAFENVVCKMELILSRPQWVKHHTVYPLNYYGFVHCCVLESRADFRFAPSQWETALLCNKVSQWLGANLESNLGICCFYPYPSRLLLCH